MDISLNDKPNQNDPLKIRNMQKKKSRRISEVVPIYTPFNNLKLKGKPDIENLLINNQESISYNNINILKTDLPNIVNDLSQLKRNNVKYPTGKSVELKKISHNSRNLDIFNNSLGDGKYSDNDKFNTTMQLRRFTQNKRNKYNGNSPMSISQLVWQKTKNLGFVGSSKNKNSRNIHNNISKNNKNFLTKNNNISSFTTKSNNEKIKFSVNKKNLLNTIKKPTKIKIEKKNIKYKIPIELMNNFGNKKKIEPNYNYLAETNNSMNRKLNLRQRNIDNNNTYLNINNTNMNERENDENNSKSFIESTLVAFNGLVSKAQQIGQILIDNKEIINDNKENDLISNQLKNSIEILNVDKKIDKLNKKIKNEQKTVEELQKINLDLNNKINLFNENSQHYEYKVKELSNVINQLKQSNSNTGSNNNSNNSNGDNNYISTVNQNFSSGEGNKYIPSKVTSNFTLERKPKKKKMKFGFVESIFMKPDKFQIINIKNPKENIANKNDNIINKKKKEKLVFVNMNKNNINEKSNDKIITNEEYQDAAEQMANHLLIESIISLKNEDDI